VSFRLPAAPGAPLALSSTEALLSHLARLERALAEQARDTPAVEARDASSAPSNAAVPAVNDTPPASVPDHRPQRSSEEEAALFQEIIDEIDKCDEAPPPTWHSAAGDGDFVSNAVPAQNTSPPLSIVTPVTVRKDLPEHWLPVIDQAGTHTRMAKLIGDL
jgi:hypothetical protein